jgi:hypothetical protein
MHHQLVPQPGLWSPLLLHTTNDDKNNYSFTFANTKLIHLKYIAGVTGITGSSLVMGRWFRFKPWMGSWRYIPLAGNDLTRVTAGGVPAIKAFINCQVDRSCGARCSEWNPRLWHFFGDIILSVGVPVGNTLKCPFSVGLGSADLN